MDSNKHWCNKLPRTSTRNKLSPCIIILPGNVWETYVIFLCSSYYRTEKYHQVIWKFSRNKWQTCIMTLSLQLETFPTRLKTFSSKGAWKSVPIQNLRRYPRQIIFLTRQENSDSPSSPGIVSLRYRNVDCVQNTFLQSPSRTHQDCRIDPRIIRIRKSESCWRHRESPFRRILTPSKHGEQRPTQRSCTTNHRHCRASTTSSRS